MRFKLANGNVIASTKQPVQWKDFDRIEIEDDYDGTALEDNMLYDGDVEFTVRVYNPSTHTIRKSWTLSSYYTLSIGTDTLGNTGSGYSKKDPYIGGKGFPVLDLKRLNYGDITEGYFYPSLAYTKSRYSHTVNPFIHNNWTSGDLIENYVPQYWVQKYQVQFRKNCGNGGPRHYSGDTKLKIQNRKIIKRVDYSIKYKVHN